MAADAKKLMFVLKVLFCLLLVVTVAVGWGSKNKVKLTDVSALTLRHNIMTNGRRSSPVPQLKCMGGTAGCSAFVPKVVQCNNRGSDGYDVQWECKADMDSQYRFGEIAVNCEGFEYPDDPYILKGSCGLEYTIDFVGDKSQHHDSGYDSGHHNSYHGTYGDRKYHRKSSGWMSSFIMWGVIAAIGYYIYTSCTTHPHMGDGTQYASNQTSSSSPPPPGFRPEYTQGDHTASSDHTGATPNNNPGYGGFWSGLGAGGLLGYLFGGSRGGYGSSHYDQGYYGYNDHHRRGHGYGGYGGNSWFGNGGGGWFGNGGGGWFGGSGNASSGWSNTHRRSSPSSSGSRTASGFGGTKRR